jgi:hypothetical protein
LLAILEASLDDWEARDQVVHRKLELFCELKGDQIFNSFNAHASDTARLGPSMREVFIA